MPAWHVCVYCSHFFLAGTSTDMYVYTRSCSPTHLFCLSYAGTNADIYVSNAPPVGAAFAYQAGLQSTLTGTVDTVTVMPTSPY